MTVIHDPRNPQIIFGGILTVYSTCRDCRTKMRITAYQQTVHCNCVERPTTVETLAKIWEHAAACGDDLLAQRAEHEIQTIDQQPPDLYTAALTYARWGWPVFPLKPGRKTPATRHGFHDATTDLGRVERWWAAHPAHNIGLATGHSFDVLDQDTEGWEYFDRLIAGGVIKEAHGVVVTASGGTHLYVKPGAPSGIAANLGNIDGIDWRGRGGFVVAPPSRLTDTGATSPRGRGWAWMFEPSPDIKEAPV